MDVKYRHSERHKWMTCLTSMKKKQISRRNEFCIYVGGNLIYIWSVEKLYWNFIYFWFFHLFNLLFTIIFKLRSIFPKRNGSIFICVDILADNFIHLSTLSVSDLIKLVLFAFFKSLWRYEALDWNRQTLILRFSAHKIYTRA